MDTISTSKGTADQPGDLPITPPTWRELHRDTHPDVEKLLYDRQRMVPAWRKLQQVGEMNAAVKSLAMSGLRKRHPDAGPAELQRRLADLFLGPELARLVYGPLDKGDSP